MKFEPMPLTTEEKNKILSAASDDDFDYMLFSVLATTGRRIGELYGTEETKVVGVKPLEQTKVIYIDGKRQIVNKTLSQYKKLGKWKFGVKVKDINFDRGTMAVWVLKRRRPAQDESLLTPEVLRLIKAYISRNKLGLDHYLFRRQGRKYRNINNVLKKYAKDADIPTEKSEGGVKKSLSVHSFRHYFITELKRKGWSDDKIMIFTGHKTANVLRGYSHVVPQDFKEEFMEAVQGI